MTLGKNFVIGIDAGGTKSRGVLVEEEGLIEVACAKRGPSNPIQVGVGRSAEVVREIIRSLSDKAMELGGKVGAVCIGMAGAGRRREVEELKRFIDAEFVTDAEAALVGGLLRRWGAVLICGTGSIAMAISPRGEKIRAGGWGMWLDDEGSGFDIALKGLRSVMRGYDGRGPKTLLRDMILNRLGLEGEEELIHWIGSAKRDEVAGLADLVFRAAEEKDKAAMAILNEAAEELVNMAETVLRRVDEPELIVLTGGVFGGQPSFRSKVGEMISARVEGVRSVPPLKGPEFGAALIAVENKKRQI